MTIHIGDFLGYWLFYTQRSVAYAFAEVLKNCCLEHQKPYIVTPPQWGVLIVLLEKDGITVGAISQRCATDMPTVTGMVKRLEQSGLLERRHSLEDRRQVNVHLTDEGQDIMRYLPVAVAAFNVIMMKGFTEDETQDLMSKMQQIVANLGEVGPDTGDRFGRLPQKFHHEL